MKKILLLGCLLSLNIVLKAQIEDPDPISEPELTKESGAQTILERLLKNDKMLNIMFDSRMDYRMQFDEDETQFNGFEGQTVKLVFHGEIVEGFRYRIRQRLNKPRIAPLRDNSGADTDLAYLEIDAGDKWTFRLGKQVMMLGTFEFDYNPADIYLFSMVNNDIDAYKTGLNVAYKAGKQTLNFQVLNSDAPQFAAEKYKNKALAGMFMWNGNLFDGVWKTKYGYGALQHDKNRYYSWITVGNQININKFRAELDWYMGDRHMDIINGNGRLVKDNAVSVNLLYNFGKLRPALKGTWGDRKDDLTGGKINPLGLQAAVEYYPFTDPLLKDLRFHAVYIYNNTSYGKAFNSLENIDNHTILAGLRWYFKIK